MMPEMLAAAVVELVGVAFFKGAIGSAPAESRRATLSVDASETRALSPCVAWWEPSSSRLARGSIFSLSSSR